MNVDPAYAFKVGCPPAAYAVKGTYPTAPSWTNGRMILKGPGLKRKRDSCEIEMLDPTSAHSTLVIEFPGDV